MMIPTTQQVQAPKPLPCIICRRWHTDGKLCRKEWTPEQIAAGSRLYEELFREEG